MNRIEKYRQYFTREYLMGPNSLKLLQELIARRPGGVRFDRTLDLGCGKALTSVFLANETDARQVFAYDLWIPATDNAHRIRDLHLDDRIIPIHGDAMNMPFAHDYFDAIVSVDAYHYFGSREGVFSGCFLPYLRKGGHAMFIVPGLKTEPQGELRKLFSDWAEGDDASLFRTCAWWQELLENECGESCEITVLDGGFFRDAWQDWFGTGHEFALRDREFLDKGLDQVLNFVMIYVKKK